MTDKISKNTYRLIVRGVLDDRWKTLFSHMHISSGSDENDKMTTIFKGTVTDQAELRGLVNKLWDMNLEIILLENLTSNLKPNRRR